MSRGPDTYRFLVQVRMGKPVVPTSPSQLTIEGNSPLYTVGVENTQFLGPAIQCAGVPDSKVGKVGIHIMPGRRGLLRGEGGFTIVKVYTEPHFQQYQKNEAQAVALAHMDRIEGTQRRPLLGYFSVDREEDMQLVRTLQTQPIDEALPAVRGALQAELVASLNETMAHEVRHVGQYTRNPFANRVKRLATIPFYFLTAGVLFGKDILTKTQQMLQPLTSSVDSFPLLVDYMKDVGLSVVVTAASYFLLRRFMALFSPSEFDARDFARNQKDNWQFLSIKPQVTNTLKDNPYLLGLAYKEFISAASKAYKHPNEFHAQNHPLSQWEAVDQKYGLQLTELASCFDRAARVLSELKHLDARSRKDMVRRIAKYAGKSRIFPARSSRLLQLIFLGSLWSDNDIERLKTGENTKGTFESVMNDLHIDTAGSIFAQTFGISLEPRVITVIKPEEIFNKILG